MLKISIRIAISHTESCNKCETTSSSIPTGLGGGAWIWSRISWNGSCAYEKTLHRTDRLARTSDRRHRLLARAIACQTDLAECWQRPTAQGIGECSQPAIADAASLDVEQRERLEGICQGRRKQRKQAEVAKNTLSARDSLPAINFSSYCLKEPLIFRDSDTPEFE